MIGEEGMITSGILIWESKLSNGIAGEGSDLADEGDEADEEKST